MLKRILSKKYYFFCLLLSFFILMFTSKCSFLYRFNDWVDANAFFTVGKSMFNGVVPYKDLFEQKGPILYFIYGIGYLISNKTFLGVFVLEVFSFSIFLYFAHKTFKMFLEEKYSLILLPILSLLITTFFAFVHGGSCEEFCLPFYAITIYYYFKHFKVRPLTNLEIIINGIMAGIIMLMKYTSLGLWIGFGLVLFIEKIKDKKIGEGIKFCLLFLLGMFIPFALVLIYFGINNGIKEFIDSYFIFNMFVYPSAVTMDTLKEASTGKDSNILAIIKYGNIMLFLILFVPMFVSFIKDIKNRKYFRNGFIVIFIISVTTVFWGFKFLKYYYIPLTAFLIISLLGITIHFKKYIDKIFNLKYSKLVLVFIVIFSIFMSYENANYKKMIKYKKKDYFHFKYAKYISKYENPTLLNMGYLDAGLYTLTGIVPNNRFFEVQNVSYEKYPDNLDDMRYNVEHKKIKFILYYSTYNIDEIKEKHSYIFDNYELVYDDEYLFEQYNMKAYLFKLKNLKEKST